MNNATLSKLGSTVEVILNIPKSEGNIAEATGCSAVVDPLVPRLVIENLQSDPSSLETSGDVGEDCSSVSSLGSFLSDGSTIEGIKFADATYEEDDDERTPRGARGMMSRWSNSTQSVLSSLKSMKDGLLPREADKVNTLTSEISDN